MEDGFTKSKDYYITNTKLCLQTIGDWVVTDTLKVNARRTEADDIINKLNITELPEGLRNTWKCSSDNLRFDLEMGVLMHTVRKVKK